MLVSSAVSTASNIPTTGTIPGNCGGPCPATAPPDTTANKAGEAAAASEAEDFAQLAEQLQLDQISKDGNGTETFQV